MENNFELYERIKTDELGDCEVTGIYTVVSSIPQAPIVVYRLTTEDGSFYFAENEITITGL